MEPTDKEVSVGQLEMRNDEEVLGFPRKLEEPIISVCSWIAPVTSNEVNEVKLLLRISIVLMCPNTD